jgi:GMP synthase-like glutamine amidotransferase
MVRPMKRVLFVQSGDTDAPGLFADVLKDRGVALDVVHVWKGEPVPADAARWAGVAVGGGSMSAYEGEEYPFLPKVEELIRDAQSAGLPVLGMCLGAQLMAKAFGGKVFANREKEIGFFDVRFTPEGANDPLWRGHAETFQPVHWHGDTFTLPPGAVHLAESTLTPNQMFRYGEKSYGFQFHLEIDEKVLTEMIGPDGGGLPRYGVDPDAFLREGRAAFPKVRPLADAIFGRWTEFLA